MIEEIGATMTGEGVKGTNSLEPKIVPGFRGGEAKRCIAVLISGMEPYSVPSHADGGSVPRGDCLGGSGGGVLYLTFRQKTSKRIVNES